MFPTPVSRAKALEERGFSLSAPPRRSPSPNRLRLLHHQGAPPAERPGRMMGMITTKRPVSASSSFSNEDVQAPMPAPSSLFSNLPTASPLSTSSTSIASQQEKTVTSDLKDSQQECASLREKIRLLEREMEVMTHHQHESEELISLREEFLLMTNEQTTITKQFRNLNDTINEFFASSRPSTLEELGVNALNVNLTESPPTFLQKLRHDTSKTLRWNCIFIIGYNLVLYY